MILRKQNINKKELELRRIELRAYRMQSDHSTTELQPRYRN